MSNKKKMIVFLAVVAFLAISAATTFFAVTNGARALGAKPTTIHLAFTAYVTTGTAKGDAITGGLTEVVQSTGYFNGNLHLPDGTQISTSGKLDDGNITISFYNMLGAPVIKGIGKFKNVGDFVGTFQVLYNTKNVDSGIWSALPVTEHKEVIALAFVGLETQASAELTGAIVLNHKTLVGTFNLANGTIMHVSAKMLKNNPYNIRVNFHYNAIIGYGKNVENPTNFLDKGYTGPFTIKANHTKGQWEAYTFGF